MGIPLGTAAAAAKASFLKRYWKWFVGGKAAMAAMLLVVVFFTFAGVEASKSAPSDVALADIPPVALEAYLCLLYTSPSPRDRQKSRMPSSA